jgi:hypothetical protein
MINKMVDVVVASFSEPLSDGKIARIVWHCPQEDAEDVNPFLVFRLALDKVSNQSLATMR